MKKYIIVPFIASVALLLTGCIQESGGAAKGTPEAQTTTPAETGEITNPPINTGETADLPPIGTIDPEDVEDPVLEITEPSNESPAAALLGGLNAYKNMDMDGFQKYFKSGFGEAMSNVGSGEEVDQRSLDMWKILFERLEWVMRTEIIDEDTAIVEVDVSNVPYTKAMEEAQAKLMEVSDENTSEDEFFTKFSEYLKEAVNNQELEMKEQTVLVYMEKTDAGWAVSDENIPLYLAVQGGADNDITEALPIEDDDSPSDDANPSDDATAE